ncbi:unnamed protein product [Boreogadus saida]
MVWSVKLASLNNDYFSTRAVMHCYGCSNKYTFPAKSLAILIKPVLICRRGNRAPLPPAPTVRQPEYGDGHESPDPLHASPLISVITAWESLTSDLPVTR